MTRSRTSLVAVGLLASVALVLAGCSSSSEPELDDPDGDARVIEHEYGQTEISGTPERVVSLGLTDADALVALGVDPVAITPGYDVDGYGPWAEQAAAAAEEVAASSDDDADDDADEAVSGPPELLDDTEIDVEAVATLDPDLIVAVSAVVDEATYEQLSAIAPTIVRPAGYVDFGVPWQQTTKMIGDAVGQSDAADALIEDATDRVAEVAGAYPRIDGTTGEVVRANPEGGWYVYLPTDARGQFMTGLGITLPSALAARDDGSSFYLDVSEENTPQLEADTIVALGTPEELEEFRTSAIFGQLSTVERDAVVYVDDQDLVDALSYSTVLSIPFAADRTAPLIADALG